MPWSSEQERSLRMAARGGWRWRVGGDTENVMGEAVFELALKDSVTSMGKIRKARSR